ncbi:MAG TPA: pitrilysin family protein [Thermoanaerobaculia bacterium]|nr:pitrilysin family protein [Thermoanaerobaculia bacterium]
MKFLFRVRSSLAALAVVLAAAASLRPAAAATPPPAAAGPFAPAAAAPAAAAPPAPAAAAPASLLELITTVEGITEYRMANGLRVLLFPDPSKSTVTVAVTYLVGSRHEGYGETGMAHLLEHMLFKGSPSHRNIPQELTSHGCRPNGSTDYDRTNYFETCPASDVNLVWALDLEADRMVNSFVARTDLDSEMTVVRNEFELGENQPREVLSERIFSAAYLWHHYGKAVIGSRSDIERVPIQNLQEFYHRWYQPDNALLVVAGRIDEARTLALIGEKFGRLPRPARTLPDTYTVEPPQDGERSVVLRRVGDVQLVGLAYHIPSGSHPDAAAIEVLGFILTDTPSGRLHKALVETHEAVSVDGGPSLMREPGLLYLVADVRKDHRLDKVRDAMLGIVEGIPADPPTAAEVQRARDSFLRQWQTRMRDSQRAAIGLSEWAAMGDWRLLFLYRDRIKEVTPGDVQRVAERYLRPVNRTVGLYLPTDEPRRAEIPPAATTPEIAQLVAAYKGGESLAAGEAWDTAPLAIEGRVERAALPAGLKLVLLPKKARGANVALALTLHLGDAASLRGHAAAGALAPAMLLRGTRQRTRQQIRDDLDHLQAQLQIFGGASAVLASLEVARPNLAPALRLLGEVLREPAFPPSELELLRQERLAQLEEAKHEPFQLAFTAFNRHLQPWPKDDPRYTPTPEDQEAWLRGATLEDVRRFYADFYGASAGELALVGDFDPAEVKALLAEILGGWRSAQPFTRLPTPYQPRPAVEQALEAPDKESSVTVAGERLDLQDSDPDYPALVLGNFLFGGGFLNSRLGTRLRQKEGLSYAVSSGFNASAWERDASFIAFASSAPQNSEKLLASLRDELQRTLAGGFAPQEVTEAKAGWLQARQLGRGQERELARNLAGRAFQGRTLSWDAELEQKVAALSPDEIASALRRHLQPAQLSVVQAGDFAKARKPKAGSSR